MTLKLLSMKKIKAQLPGTVFLGLLITGSLFQSSGALAQQIAKMRFVWDFTRAGGAIYFTICDDLNSTSMNAQEDVQMLMF